MFAKIVGFDSNETVSDVLSRNRGIGPGFDLLRILLALYIFYGHTFWIAGGETSVQGVAVLDATAGSASNTVGPVGGGGFSGWTRPFHVAAVPVFFALSGFLVFGSAVRLRVTTTFLAFRFLRIFPALVVETFLCAFFLGSVLTTLPLNLYFTDAVFWRYLGNMLGFVAFNLPGVFEQHPVKGIVNANLWTLPSEFYCYFLIALLMMTRVIFNRKAFSILYGFLTVSAILASLVYKFGITNGIPSSVVIIFYFFTGILLFHWQEKLRTDLRLFIACGAVGYGLLLYKELVFLAPLFVTYCVVIFGMFAIPKIPLLSKGDYSYGVYLYGFPIAQAVFSINPLFFRGNGWALLTVSILITGLFSAISWHFVEIHFLKLKKHLPTRFFPRA